MGTEIEVKILNINFELIQKKIENIGAKLKWHSLIETTVYDFPDRRLILSGGYVRVRNEGKKWRCTYKKKISSENTKTCEEIDFGISDPENMKTFLNKLGLEKILSFEKLRWHYKKGAVYFDIDEIPGIPKYLEIEAPSSSKIDSTLEKLGIDKSNVVTFGPKELLAMYGIDIDKIKELRFQK